MVPRLASRVLRSVENWWLEAAEPIGTDRGCAVCHSAVVRVGAGERVGEEPQQFGVAQLAVVPLVVGGQGHQVVEHQHRVVAAVFRV